jgi:hypothetical protein
MLFAPIVPQFRKSECCISSLSAKLRAIGLDRASSNSYRTRVGCQIVSYHPSQIVFRDRSPFVPLKVVPFSTLNDNVASLTRFSPATVLT